ncbi:MAG: hypothetical protein LW626_08755, partial [Verrucomicrobium sp.]|nr:hypothetical protein [Verrucomicrobium sp.]
MSTPTRSPLRSRRLRTLAAGVLIALLGAPTAGALERERLFGPEVKTGDYKHPASFTELRNGDL